MSVINLGGRRVELSNSEPEEKEPVFSAWLYSEASLGEKFQWYLWEVPLGFIQAWLYHWKVLEGPKDLPVLKNLRILDEDEEGK